MKEFNDDGRTIADMSGVSRRSLFGFNPNKLRPDGTEDNTKPDDSPRAEETEGFSREDRIWAILGALKAVLLVGLCFAVGMALIILAFQLL